MLLEECAGIHYGGDVIDQGVDQYIGVTDGSLLAKCIPHKNFKKMSFKYWRLPKEFKNMVRYDTEKITVNNLMFLHYAVDRAGFSTDDVEGQRRILEPGEGNSPHYTCKSAPCIWLDMEAWS